MKVVSICFFLLVACLSFSQTAAIDSLREGFRMSKKDTLKLNYCKELIGEFYLRNTDSAMVYTNTCMRLAKEIDNKLYIASFTHNLALIYEQTTSREKAIEQYLKAVILYKEIDHFSGLWKVHSALISRYNELGNLEKALSHYEEAKKYVADNDLEGKAALNNRIGMVYGYQGEMETAMRYFELNLPLYYQLQNNYGLGFTHQNVGICLGDLNQPDSALYHLTKGLAFQRLSNRPQGLASNLSSLGDFHINQKNYEDASKYIKEAISILENGNSTFYLVTEYGNLAEVYRKLADFDQSILFGEKALGLAETTQDLATKRNLLGLLSSSYEAKANFKQALFYEKQRLVINDSLSSTANKKVIEELEQQYQAMEKQTQIDMQNSQLGRQRVLLIAILLIAALLFGLAFLAFRNARQKQQVNEQLRQLDQTKSNFFANVSHELRTPLTLIVAPLENAIQKSKNQTQKEDLELAHNNSKKLLNLVNEILDLSKLEEGKLQITTKPVHLQTFLRRVFYAFESLTKIRGIDLHFEWELPEEIWVEIDLPKMEKILNNLLSNALKYTAIGDKISLSVKSTSENQLTISVEDTGKGILKEDLPRIFNRFYQGEQNGGQLVGGTGIGLALAREYARLLEGNLTVKSTIGKGSIFKLQLPLVQAEPLERTTNLQEKITEKEVTITTFQPQVLFVDKPKILVVEDNLEMSQFLVKILSPYYRCVTALNGVEGLEKLTKNRFDLIISDVMMPEMDGFTFLQKVHERELFSHTPVIMLTARALESDKLQGLQLGVDDYITKPFNTNELLARIDNLLKNKQEREEWQRVIKNDLTVETPSLTVEQALLKEAETLIVEQLSNSDFKVGDLAKALNYSQRQLERIIKKLTGFSPLNFIKEIRLQQARQLLDNRQFATVAEVGYEVGFADPGYFSKVYQKRFGKKPSEI